MFGLSPGISQEGFIQETIWLVGLIKFLGMAGSLKTTGMALRKHPLFVWSFPIIYSKSSNSHYVLIFLNPFYFYNNNIMIIFIIIIIHDFSSTFC